MGLEQLFSGQLLFSFVFLSLGAYIITLIIRSIIEVMWVGVKDNKYWREIFLPLGGIANGMILGGVLQFFPLPELLGAHISNRILFGAICGLFASFMYNRIKSWINNKISS